MDRENGLTPLVKKKKSLKLSHSQVQQILSCGDCLCDVNHYMCTLVVAMLTLALKNEAQSRLLFALFADKSV